MSAPATAGSQAGLDLFDRLEIDYEHAYVHNTFKAACIQSLIALLPAHATVLDVGCGTGRPVFALLADADLHVIGSDISPKMIELAKQRVKGEFVVADMLTYAPPEGTKVDAVVIMFSHLQLSSWQDFYDMMRRYAALIAPGGYLVIGTMAADTYATKASDYDATGTYCVDFLAPFMGYPLPTFFLSKKGMRNFVEGMGLEIVSEEEGAFQPDYEKAEVEMQQYIIAKRPEGLKELGLPEPRP